MAWQTETLQSIMDGLPDGARADVVGSAADPVLLDRWSDVDLHLHLVEDVDLAGLVAPSTVWVITEQHAPDHQLLRIVLTDGRRLDLSVRGNGRLTHPHDTSVDDPRMLLVLAAVKLGRGDRLIGAHLLLVFLQHCLVQAMELPGPGDGAARSRRSHHHPPTRHRPRQRN